MNIYTSEEYYKSNQTFYLDTDVSELKIKIKINEETTLFGLNRDAGQFFIINKKKEVIFFTDCTLHDVLYHLKGRDSKEYIEITSKDQYEELNSKYTLKLHYLCVYGGFLMDKSVNLLTHIYDFEILEGVHLNARTLDKSEYRKYYRKGQLIDEGFTGFSDNNINTLLCDFEDGDDGEKMVVIWSSQDDIFTVYDRIGLYEFVKIAATIEY